MKSGWLAVLPMQGLGRLERFPKGKPGGNLESHRLNSFLAMSFSVSLSGLVLFDKVPTW